MTKWILCGLSILLLTACGDGYAGGPDDMPPGDIRKEQNVTISIPGGPESSVRFYIGKSGTGDARFDIELKKGVNIIKFSHMAFYADDKNKDALCLLKKEGKSFFHIIKKSLEKPDDKTAIDTIYIENKETYTVKIDVPDQEDRWELYFIAKSDLGDDVAGYFPNPATASRTAGSDILYKYQWHLENKGSNDYTVSEAVAGNDINVKDVWNSYTGKGVTVAVIDQGIEVNHPDLAANIDIGQSWNYLSGSMDTTPTNPDYAHGTAVAGIIAASANNGIGGRGVAPDASLVSLNMLESQSITDWSLPLESLVRGIDESSIDIFNNSWGSIAGTVHPNPDSTDSLYYQFANQLKYGTLHGRDGKGAIYVKSAGNDRQRVIGDKWRPFWNANLDPEQVERFMIVVGASKADGKFSWYSTPGANLLLNAPGGWTQKEFLEVDEHMIVTTDLSGMYRGYDYRDGGIDYHFDATGNENYDYTNRMNGTSAAGPMVSGVVALMLEANPDLTWRDIRYILATTATKNGGSYVTNAAGHSFSNTYGFGRVDAKAAVEKATGWPNMDGEKEYAGYFPDGESLNDENNRNLSKAKSVLDIAYSDIENIEYVNIELSVKKTDSEEIVFDQENNNEKELEGYYAFDFAMSNIDNNATEMDVMLTCGDIEIFKDIKITSGTAERKGNIAHAFSKDDCRVYFRFDNSATEGDATWSLKLTKGYPLPDMSHMKITLTSPGGTSSVLLDAPNGIDEKAKFIQTRFGSNAFLDESADGSWALSVEETPDFDDKKDAEDLRSFRLENMKIEIYGR